MRLHRLSLAAFGPFAEPVDIDFDALGAGGIFLIHGATGSGKTSLLDAICFALFARLPGERPAGASLSSHHAAADAVPTVTLEATLSGRRLRISRTPDHLRFKRRGAGTTMAKASVLVEESVAGGWVTRATRADEAGLLLTNAIGMQLDQFVKVVLLPQGDFAAFLRASADQRGDLLERLFDISRYVEIERWLAQRRRTDQLQFELAASAAATERARVDDLLAGLPDQVAAVAPTTCDDSDDPIPGLDRLLARVRDHAVSTLAAGDRADTASDAAEAAVVAATALSRDRARGERAGRDLAELAGRADELRRAGELLAAAERAEHVAGDLRALTALSLDADRAARQKHLALSRLAELDVAAAQLATASQDLARHDDTVARLAVLDAQLRAADHEREALEQARGELAGQRFTVAAQAAELTITLHETDHHLGELAQQAARVEPLTQQAEHLDRLAALRADLDLVTAQHDVATAQAQRALGRAQDARQSWLDLRQRRLDGMAAELAAGLSPDEPCPVCGAHEHPAPARTTDAVTEAELSAAQAGWELLDTSSQQAHQRVAALAERCRARTLDLAGEPRDHATLLTAAASTRDQVRAAFQAADDLARIRSYRDDLARRAAALAERLEVTSTALAQLEGSLAAATADRQREVAATEALLARHTLGCPCATADQERDVEALVARHRIVADAVRVAGEARDSSARSADALTAQRGAVQQACAAAGFPDEQAAAAARLSPAERESLRTTLSTAEQASAAARAVLTDQAVRQALDTPQVDLAAVTEAARAARAVRVEVERQRTLAELAVRELAAAIERIAATAAAERSARDRADRSRRLADTVAGLGSDNVMRMRLSAFVLAGRLERVVELANERLALMGSGRFRLTHSDARDGAKRSGLGLRIEDQWTGSTRETATLSGGESFMASLALALGLADAVREDSGGADVQTLFIDEGFGTLDEESLEQVMTVLDQLRDGGRAVGVVSHVADLRSRIPTQLRVLKAADGSTVEVVDGAA